MFRQNFRGHPALPGVGLGFMVDDTFGDLVDGSKTKLIKFTGGCEGPFISTIVHVAIWNTIE